MKTLITMTIFLMASFAHANMSIDGGAKLYLSEIECLESSPDKTGIECETRSDMVICSTLFDARLNNGGSKNVKLQTYAEIACDSKLWRNLTLGLTDKINAASARSEAKLELKSLIKEVNSLKKCN